MDPFPETDLVRTAAGHGIALYHWDEPPGGADSRAVLIVPGFHRRARSPRTLRFARALARRHRVSIAEMRGHGSSEGRYTFGREEWRDLPAVFERVAAVRGEGPIAVTGFSLGGTISVLAADRFPEVRRRMASLLLISAVARLASVRPRPTIDIMSRFSPEDFWRVPRIAWGRLGAPGPDAVEAIGRLAPLPISIVHAEGDWLVPVKHAHLLFEAAREPKELRVLPNTMELHADAIVEYLPGVLEEHALGWLARALGGAEVDNARDASPDGPARP